MTCGGMQAISRDWETAVLNGAADSRHDGAAMAHSSAAAGAISN